MNRTASTVHAMNSTTGIVHIVEVGADVDDGYCCNIQDLLLLLIGVVELGAISRDGNGNIYIMFCFLQVSEKPWLMMEQLLYLVVPCNDDTNLVDEIHGSEVGCRGFKCLWIPIYYVLNSWQRRWRRRWWRGVG